MKVLFLNDTHIGFRRSNKIFEEHILGLLEDVVSYVSENKIEVICHLGDFFDVRTNINLISLKAVKERFLAPLERLGVKLHIIPGNHDCSYRHSVEANSVSLVFNEFKNVSVYNEPTVVDFVDGTNLLMVPWIGKDDEKKFISMVDELSLKTEICCGHFEFSSFLYQAGIVASHGMDSKMFTPKFDVILSGHYHAKSTSGNVTYLGTQYDLSWADYEDKKFFHILDTETKELESIENPKRIYFKIFYDESFVNDEFFDELQKNDYKSKIVKVIILSRKNMITFDSFMEKLYEHAPYEVSIIDESITKAKEEITVDTSILMKSTLEIIDNLLLEIPMEGYNIGSVKRLMHDFYEEAEEC